MAYKRYIKRGGKLYGPYIYHSRKEGGSVISEYRGKHHKDSNVIFLIIGLSLLFLLIFISTFGPAFNINPFGLIVEDTQNDIETTESEDVASIRFVIELSRAEHLDSNKNFMSDIYGSVKELDDIWSEPILDTEYVRITFEEDLTSKNDITIYPRIISGTPKIEVYEIGGTEIISEFTTINPNEYNKIFLTSLQGSQDTFDLRVLDGSLEFDYIFDPVQFARPNADNAVGSWTTTPLWSKVDEGSPGDDVEISSDLVGNNADTTIAILNLSSVTDPVSSSGHIIRVRWKNGGEGGSGRHIIGKVRLRQGTTQIALFDTVELLGSVSTFQINTSTLTTSEADSITNYSNLNFEVWGRGSTGGGVRSLRVDFIELEVPGVDTEAPKWQNNQTNSTLAGTYILHSVNWTDNTALSGYIFSFDNGTGTLINDSFVEFSGSPNWSNVTKFVNQTVGATIRWRVYANDSLNNLNSTDIFIYTTTTSADVDPPDITIDSPTNTTFATGDIDYNITLDEALDFAFASVDSGSNFTMDNDSNTHYFNISGNHPTLSDGFHNITFWVNDSSGNANEGTIFFTVDTTFPTIDFVVPTEANNSQLTRDYIQVNVTASDTNLDTITIFLYNSTALVQTNTSTTSPLFINFTGLPDETYSLNSTVNDTANNVNQTETRTITIDTGPPTINYVSPTEASGIFRSQNFVLVNVTASDPNLDTITIRLYNSSNDSIRENLSTISAFFINYTNLVDGLYFYNATANDTIGNVNNTGTRNITIDTINPSLVIVEPQNITYTTTSLDINFTVSDDNLDTCWYTDDGGSANNTLASCANTSYTASQGSTTIRLYANDSAGNLNGTESVTFFVDSITPLIDYTTGTENNNTAFARDWIFVNVTVTETNFQNITFRLYNSTSQVNITTYTSQIFEINFTSLSDEAYTYNVTIVDTANNENSTETRFITLDNINPTVNYVSPTENSGVVRGRNYIEINVTATDTNLDTILIRLYNSTNDQINSSTTTSSPNFINFTGLSDGLYFYNATSNDTSGNENSTATRNITLDTSPPNTDFVSPTEDSGVSKSQTYIIINVTATDSGFGLDTIIIRLYNSTNDQINSSTTTSSPNFINFSNLALGTYFYNATANDTNGNVNNTETRNITLSSDSPPTVNIVFPANQTYTVNVSDLNYTATDDVALSACWYSLDDGATNITITCGQNVTGLTSNEGSNTWRVYANDSAAQESSDSVTFFKDTIIPTIDFVIPTTSAGNLSQDFIEANITSTDTNLDTITLFLYNSTALVQTNTSTTSPLFINFTGLPDETYSLNSTVNDTANNVNQTETRTITLDTTFPLISLTNPQNITYTSVQTQLNYTVSDVNLDTCWYSTDNGASNTTIACGTNVTGLNSGQGSSTWKVYVNDTVGNENSSSVTFFVDSINPLIDYTTGTENNNTAFARDWIFVNVSVTETNEDTITFVLFNSTSQVNTTSFTDSTRTINFTSLPDETYIYNVTVNDTVGNTNNTETRFITLDNIIPTIDYVSPTENSGVVKGQNFILINITSTDTNLDNILIRLYNSSNDQINSSLTSTSPNFINFTGLSDGLYFYNATSNDTAGNENSTTTRNITLDSVAPVINYVSPTENSGVSRVRDYIEINVTAIDDSLDTIIIRLYNSSNDQINSSLTSTSPNFINFTGLSDGLYFYNATANDTLTNQADLATRNITLDTTNPSLVIVEPQNITYTTTSLDINFTISDDNLDECWYTDNGGATNNTLSGCANTTYTASQGSTTIRLYANDTVGNLNNTESVTFFVDSIFPTIQFVSPTETSGDSLGRNYIQVNVTAADTNLDTITIRLYNSTSELVQTNTLTSSPLFVNFTGLTDSLYFFNSTVNDTVGNENSTATRNVSLVTPTLILIKPENETYITTESLLLEFTVSLEDFVWYNIDNGANTTITGNTTFNTTSGQRTLNLYANNSNGETVKNVTFTVNSTKFSVIFDEFSGLSKGLSTAFNQSSHEDLQNLSDIILEHINHGKISFNVAINVTDDLNVTDNKVDLDTHVNISSNRIELNSTALPNFNKSATLYLYNLTFSNPRILRDGVVCPTAICTKESYLDNTLKFNVTSFTVYSSEETPADGEQPPVGGGGAGGGAGGVGGVVECLNDSACRVDEVCLNFECVKLFDVKIIDFESPVRLGDFFDFTYSIKGVAEINADVEVNFWIEKNGEIITSGLDTIYLGSFEEKTETTKIFLPSNIESGIYTFVVEVDYGSYSARSERTIEITVGRGVAIITLKDVEGIRIYAIIILIILAVLITSLIFYLERKKIKSGFVQETRWIKKHKISILVSVLFIVIITLGYFLNLFGPLVLLVKSPFFYYALRTIFVLVAFLIIIFIVKKINFFQRFKSWGAERRAINRLRRAKRREIGGLKRERLRFKARRVIKVKPKTKQLIDKPRRQRTQFKKIFLNFIHSFLISIEKVAILFARFSGKLFRGIEIFLRVIRKKIILLFREFKHLEITHVKFDLSGLFKFKLRKKRIPAEKKKKFKLVKKPKPKLRIGFKAKRILNSIYNSFDRFYKRFKRQAKELDKFSLGVIKRVSERHDILGLSTNQRIKEFWDVGKKLPYLIPKEVQKKPRKGLFLKSPFRKLKRSITDLIKPLESFLSREEKKIVKERRIISKGVGRAIGRIHKDVFYLLNKLFGKKSHKAIFQDFERTLVRTGKFTKRHLKTLRDIINAHIEFKKTKSNLYYNIREIEKEAEILITDLIDYLQKSNTKEKKRIKAEVDQYVKAPATIKHLYRKAFRNFKSYITVSTDAIKKLFIGDTREQETEETDIGEIPEKRETYQPQLPELESDEETTEELIDEVGEEIEESEEPEKRERPDEESDEKDNYGF